MKRIIVVESAYMNNYPIPKEHGAYVVLLAAWLFGIVYSHCVDITGFALALILPLSLFFLQGPVRPLIHRKRKEKIRLHPFSITCFGISLFSGLLLALHSPRILYSSVPLAVITALYFYFVRRRSAQLLLSFIGFSGLALITPVTVLASNCEITVSNLIIIWLFVSLFFWGSLVCVNIRLSGGNGIARAMIYHILASTIILFFAYYHSLRYSAITVIGISFLRLVIIIIYHSRYVKIKMKHIGIQESIIAALGVIVSALPF
ncbi:MAG: YwiC-like family protein [Candidatus Kapaibacterium sp.]